MQRFSLNASSISPTLSLLAKQCHCTCTCPHSSRVILSGLDVTFDQLTASTVGKCTSRVWQQRWRELLTNVTQLSTPSLFLLNQQRKVCAPASSSPQSPESHLRPQCKGAASPLITRALPGSWVKAPCWGSRRKSFKNKSVTEEQVLPSRSPSCTSSRLVRWGCGLLCPRSHKGPPPGSSRSTRSLSCLPCASFNPKVEWATTKRRQTSSLVEKKERTSKSSSEWKEVSVVCPSQKV